MDIKTIIEFSMKSDIEEIVSEWAEENGFDKCPDTGFDGLVDINNVTYCYCLNQGKTKTLLTIHQLDEIIRLEAWIVEEIKQDKESMKRINELLIRLSQRPTEK